MTILPEVQQRPDVLSLQQQFLCLFGHGDEARPIQVVMRDLADRYAPAQVDGRVADSLAVLGEMRADLDAPMAVS